MEQRSIRWQLSLTYAAIALIAALVSGVVLMTVLQNYYHDLERDIMERNARVISRYLSSNYGSEQTSLADLSARLRDLAVLPQVRISFLDPDGNVIADSGTPGPRMVTLSLDESLDHHLTSTTAADPIAVGGGWYFNPAANTIEIVKGEAITEPLDLNKVNEFWTQFPSDGQAIVTRRPLNVTVTSDNNFIMEGAPPPEDASWLTLAPSLYGYNFVNGYPVNNQKTQARSDQNVQVAVYDHVNTPDEQDSELLGYVRVSDVPAIGRDVLNSVLNGWIVAATVAVFLAACVGWFISYRFMVPLRQLTETTAMMADGDLSARAKIERRDELGILARSFNMMATQIEGTFHTLHRFIADAAHEIHTPLTALQTHLELIGEQHVDLQLEQVFSQINRLEHLADSLLNLSRIESVATHHQPINLYSVAERISALYASQAEQADQEFILQMSGHLPPINGDEAQLEQMLCNLLDNALKFTPTGGTITFRITHENKTVHLQVEDTGIGIPDEDMQSLFERFHRGRNTARYPGSGLGLAIVKAITTAHNGTVEVASMPGQTCFNITLPIAH